MRYPGVGGAYGHSQRPGVIDYIRNQEEQHKKRGFRAEYLQLLRRFEIPHDEGLIV